MTPLLASPLSLDPKPTHLISFELSPLSGLGTRSLFQGTFQLIFVENFLKNVYFQKWLSKDSITLVIRGKLSDIQISGTPN